MKSSKRFCFPALLLLIFRLCARRLCARERTGPGGRAFETQRPLTVAGPSPTDKNGISGAATYQINYAKRIVNGEVASLHFEIPVIVAPGRASNQTTSCCREPTQR